MAAPSASIAASTCFRWGDRDDDQAYAPGCHAPRGGGIPGPRPGGAPAVARWARPSRAGFRKARPGVSRALDLQGRSRAHPVLEAVADGDDRGPTARGEAHRSDRASREPLDLRAVA